MTTTPKPRGGRRPGAGRKPSGRVQVTVRVNPQTLAAIQASGKRLAEKAGLTRKPRLGEILEADYQMKARR